MDRNGQRIWRLFDEVVTQGRLDVIDELYATDFVDRCPGPDQQPGPAGIRQVVARYRGAFPDLSVVIEDMVSEGEKVAIRETWRGTHKGEIFGIAPSNRTLVASRMHIFRFRDGRIVEEWSEGSLLNGRVL